MQFNKKNIERWMRLRKKLRAQIIATHSSARLQTLMKRLSRVNENQRAAMRELGAGGLQHSGIAVSDVIACIKASTMLNKR